MKRQEVQDRILADIENLIDNDLDNALSFLSSAFAHLVVGLVESQGVDPSIPIKLMIKDFRTITVAVPDEREGARGDLH